MKTNKEYKNEALAALKGNWAPAVLAYFVIMVLSAVVSAMSWGIDNLDLSSLADKGAWIPPMLTWLMLIAMAAFVYLIAIPASVGMINSFNLLYCRSDINVVWNMRELATINYGQTVLGMFMMGLITSLYSILLFVPGVIASLALFLVPYILKDNPDLSVMDTLRLSRKMMDGHKMKLFKLQLSFLGWIFLNVLTLGLASLWLVPYMMTTFAAFYQDVKAEYFMKEVRQESAL